MSDALPKPRRPPGPAEPFSLTDLAYTLAFDVFGAPSSAGASGSPRSALAPTPSPLVVAAARRLLRAVARSGLEPVFQVALLRRLALAEWMKADRPRPARDLSERRSRESDALRFFRENWGASYDDIAVTVGISEDEARSIIHKARLDFIYAEKRLHAAGNECRLHRERLSDFREALLPPGPAAEVAAHVRGCRACATVDFNLVTLLDRAALPLQEAPDSLAAATSTLRFLTPAGYLTRRTRAAGIALSTLGVVLGLAELNPDVRDRTQRLVDRGLAFLGRGQTWAGQRVEDLRVIRDLVSGLIDGRGEGLGALIDDYMKAREESARRKEARDAPRNEQERANKTPSEPVDTPEGPKSNGQATSVNPK